MAWNPDQYNRFKTERFAPFYDLLQLMEVKEGLKVIDLGCGTGELTHQLAQVLPKAKLLGIDSSAEMLAKAAAFANQQLKFEQRTIEDQLKSPEKWDLVFSNAALQWVDGHEQLFPRIVATLRPGGQLLVQMPSQTENLLNRLLNALIAEEPFVSALNGWSRPSPVLSTEAYAQLLFEQGGTDIHIFEKIYPVIVTDPEELYNWIAGTALIPYVERLEAQPRAQLITEFKKRIKEHFTKRPILYPFKRIIIAAKFEAPPKP